MFMRETWHMVEGDYDDVELVTEGSMTPKVAAQLLKLFAAPEAGPMVPEPFEPLLWRRQGR
jgi:hypothetical protein